MNQEVLIFVNSVVSNIMQAREFLEFWFIVDILFVPIVLLNFITKIVLDVQSVESLSSNLKVRKDFHSISIFFTKLWKKIPNFVIAISISTRKTKNRWLESFVASIAKGSSIFIVQIIKLSSAESALSCITLTTIALLWIYMKFKE